MIPRLVVIFVVTVASHVYGSLPPSSPCPLPTDRLLGSTCFEFTTIGNVSVGDSIFEAGSKACADHGKTMAVVATPGEQYFVAVTMKDLGWPSAMVGLRYRRTAWRWTADGRFIRRQGCVRNSMGSQLIQKLPSKFTNSMTTSHCSEFCAEHEHAFAAIQDGSYCYCAPNFVWTESAIDCSTPCSGAQNEQCGSTFNSAVHFTAEDSFDFWQKGRPGVTGHCAATDVTQPNATWVDHDCKTQLSFLCKFVETNAQPYGAVRSACSPNACYYLFTTPKLNWQDADKFCIKIGGRLATVEDSDRQNLVTTLLSSEQGPVLEQNKGVESRLVWIGASNMDWYFEDESPLELRHGWASSGEPVNQEERSCADLIVGSLSNDDIVYGWRTRQCVAEKSEDDTEEKPITRVVCSSTAADVPASSKKTTTEKPKQVTTAANKADEITNETDLRVGSGQRQILATQEPVLFLFNDDDTKVEQEPYLPWWSILLIVIAALILILLVVFVTIAIIKRGMNTRGKASGRISPTSTITKRWNQPPSRQSSARTTHGRNNQVLLY